MIEKSAFIVFLGNINYDSRCYYLIDFLAELKYKVSALGFDWFSPEFKTSVSDPISIYKLKKSPFSIFFYLKFALIISFRLLTTKYTVYFAEDIYTLPFAVIAAKLKKGKVIYNAREIYASLAGLVGKKRTQIILKRVETYFIKKVDLVHTNGEMDAEYLKKEYNIPEVLVIRNLPVYKKPVNVVNYSKYFNLPADSRFLIYQGVILHGRGLKNIYKALRKLSAKYFLIIIGDGEYKDYYQSLAEQEGISDKVKFTGRIEQDKLSEYTAGGTVGLSLIENVSLSYYYALPNKLFEYILCELPVIVTDMPQMKKIVDEYEVGFSVADGDIDDIIHKLKLLEVEKTYIRFKENCKKASLELNLNKEIQKLIGKI